MPLSLDHPGYLRAQKRLLDEIEHGVRAANRQIIHERVPGLDRDAVLRLAATGAALRADYLAAALRFGRDGAARRTISDSELRTLQAMRLAYAEGVAAFAAVQRAIARGYVDLALPGI